MEDIGALPWMKSILDKAKFIVKFVTTKPKVLNIFRAHSTLDFPKPSMTRFCYMYIVLDRVLRVRKGLLCTVVAEDWYNIQEVRGGDTLFTQFSVLVMGDDEFWTKGDTLVAAIQSVYNVLRITYMEGSTLSLLYEYIDRIQESIQKVVGLSDIEKTTLCDAVRKRWDWFHKPIHAVAHILHPLWRSEQQFTDIELENSWIDYIMRWSGGDVAILSELETERLQFRSMERYLGQPIARLRENQIASVTWWEKYGVSTPLLVSIFTI
ncbi:hypothetical protein KP509_36G054200 [Ceratopteris richardii]|uniref:Uncharacterized protein n=1 Tax=Ceratopteris richardii TaxID=49495 RepID=A0A8T2QD73_CERRI|nr:hypothetical protein KP509_36G054200 [Ceratopteris richardii]